MQRFKALSISTVLLVLGSIGLSACGGDPTPTAVPPTATTKPAATAKPAATSTPKATATTAAPAGRAATSAEISAINDSLAAAKDLKTYHFDIDVKPSEFITQPVKAQGDYEAPDLTYVKGTISNKPFENIIIGDVVFEKNSSGKYVKKETTTDSSSSDPLSGFSSENFITSANPLQDIDSFADMASEYKYEGDLQVDGVKVKHFTFALDLEKMANDQGMTGIDLSDLDLGGGGFYVDDQKKVLYGVEYNLNVTAFLELLTRAFSSFGGTPTPGGAKPTALPRLDLNMVMKITKHDDSSIHVPVTDEMRAEVDATPTEDPFAFPTEEPLETPQVETTPEVAETPVVDETPEAGATSTAGSGTSSELFDIPKPAYYTTTYGYSYVVGIINYKGTDIRAQPDIVVTLTDAQGNVIDTEDASIKPGIIIPGKPIPYQASFSDAPEAIGNIEVTIDADVADDFDLEYGYHDFTTEGVSLTLPKDEYDNLKLVGRVKNTGTKDASLVQLIGITYDANGVVTDVAYAYSKVDTIKAGASSPFDMDFNNARDAAKYEIIVTAWPAN